jgi:hypothetical protein
MRSAFTITWVALYAAAASAADPPKYPDLVYVRQIYIAPMASGFDQYLANRLTQGGRFQVVTDPQIAEAILTDRIGESFEAYFATLYPPPKPETENAEEEGDLEAEQPRTRVSAFNRARGNLYLVERASRKVIWSDYRRPRNTRPDELDDLADHFAGRLRKQAGKAVPQPPPSPPVSSPPASAEPKSDTGAPAPK